MLHNIWFKKKSVVLRPSWLSQSFSCCIRTPLLRHYFLVTNGDPDNLFPWRSAPAEYVTLEICKDSGWGGENTNISPLDEIAVTLSPHPDAETHPTTPSNPFLPHPTNYPSTNLLQCTNNVKHSVIIIGRVEGAGLTQIQCACVCLCVCALRLPEIAFTGQSPAQSGGTRKVNPILETQISTRCWYYTRLLGSEIR